MARNPANLPSGERFEWDEEVAGLARRVRANGSATWVVQWRVDGRTLRRTLGSADRLTCEAARRTARQLRGLDVAMPTVTAFAEVALRDCAGRWKPSTLETHRGCVRRIAATSLGTMPVDQVSRQHITNAMANLRGDTARLLAVLSFVMQHAELKRLRKSGCNPCKGLRRRSAAFRARYLQPAEYRRLFQALDAHAADLPPEVALIRFLAFTGARLGEALTLTWDQLAGQRAVLRDSKTGPKTLWLCREAAQLLDALPCTQPNAEVFLPDHSRLSVRNRVRIVWSRAVAAAALGRVRLHDLRHSFASVGASLGIDLRILAGLLGHADYSSTLGYAHLDRAPVGRAAERVSRRLALALRPTEAVTPLRPVAKPLDPRPDPALRPHIRDYRKNPADWRVFCHERGLDPDAFVTALRQDRERRLHRASTRVSS
jgi:integrase